MRVFAARSGRTARLVAAAAGAIVVLLGTAAPGLACTTAVPPRPVADFRAATPVVLGTIEHVDEMRLTIRVAVAYRGSPGPVLSLQAPDGALDWCAFPWAPPKAGDRVLIAVVDPSWWAWPNTGVWVVDSAGRIVEPSDPPWVGAGAPATVEDALRTMGIAPPDSATTTPAPEEPRGGPPAMAGAVAWVAGLACVAWWLGRRSRAPLSTVPRGRGARVPM